ncbi:conserved exported hypothetical protein [Candidatus Terasakiella magnetica]|nr:conserved exported hypothetical protein [Candidatus Terasakiella magnetica]
MKRAISVAALISVLTACSSSSNPLPSPLSSISTPKAMFDLAIEARSFEDIGKDVAIYVEASRILVAEMEMAISMEIYEQRLLLTGIINDAEACQSVRERASKIDGIRAFYWHVSCATSEDESTGNLIGIFRRNTLRTFANLRLMGALDVADVNFRVAINPQRQAIILGRARSEDERQAALKALSQLYDIEGVIDHIEVRS